MFRFVAALLLALASAVPALAYPASGGQSADIQETVGDASVKGHWG